MKLLVLTVCTLLGYTVADTRVDITVAARDLKDADLWEPPDTFATVLYAASDSDPYNRVGKTLTVDNSYSPVWTESFTFVSFPGSNVQRIKIEIWDGDWSNPDDLLGFVEFPLNNIINAAGNQLELALSRGAVLVSGRINATRMF